MVNTAATPNPTAILGPATGGDFADTNYSGVEWQAHLHLRSCSALPRPSRCLHWLHRRRQVRGVRIRRCVVFEVQEEELQNVRPLSVDKDYLHILVDEVLLRAQFDDLVWIAKGLLYLVGAHAER